MRITYLEAKNFIGIYAGTGKKEIKINFDNENSITMLLGGNGSGKSTLMSILHPFRETFDNRKKFIFEGQDGYKEVHLVHNNDMYIIKHYYGKNSNKNKSYINKNDVELNENGNISSFNEILNKEFNLTKDYFTISKVGSNVAGFIGLSTANRKDLINKFVPNIDEFLEAFEIVNEKAKKYNTSIKNLKSSLEKINKEELLTNKSSIETKIKLLDKEIDLFNSEVISSDTKLKIFQENLNAPSNISELYKDSLDAKINEDKEYNKYLEKYSNLSNYDLDSIKEKLSDMEKDIYKIDIDMKSKKEELDGIENKLISADINKIKFEDLLKETQDGFISTSDIKTQIANLSIELNSNKNELEKAYNGYKEVFNTLVLDDFRIAKSELINLFESVDKLRDNTDYNIINNYHLNDLTAVNDNIVKTEEFKNELIKKEAELSSQLEYLEKNNEKYSMIYKQKPEDCNRSECAFIKDAVNFFENEYPKYDELSYEKTKVEERIDELEKALEEKYGVKEYLTKLTDLINQTNYSRNYLPELDSSKYATNKEKMLSAIEYGDKCITLSTLISDNELNVEKLKNLLEVNSIKEKQIEEFKSNIEEANIELKTYEEKNTNAKKELEEIKASRKRKENTIMLLTKFKDIFINHNKVNEEYSSLKEIYENNLEILNNISKEEELIRNKKELIREREEVRLKYSDNLKDINNNLFLFETYSKELKEIESNINELELVKEALDPKKGIPLIFMKNYLNKVGASANKLLDAAYNGDFKIKFKISSKEFLIQVFKSDGSFLNDISEASQGELSLTTIALSLAMMENLLKNCKYNVLYLDEVDATLSTSNRRIFIDLLNIQMKNENIEQTFLISHNNEFYSQPIDLILFSDNNLDKNNEELMENKKVLWDINNL